MRFISKLVIATALTSFALPALAATTHDTGAGEAFANYQPSLALTELFAANGYYPVASSNGLEDGALNFTIGMIRNFAGNFAPGYEQADGHHLQSTSESTLFSVIGNAYGSNGGTDFGTPDLRRTTIVGAASPSGPAALNGYLVGQQTGSEGTTLTADQLPAHSHTLPGGGVTTETGGGMAFDQRQPSLSMTYLIAAGGYYPNGGTPVSIGQVAAFAGAYIPRGWRPADGSLISIADNQSLFSIIGTTYGGNGITNFALPNLVGRTVVGSGAAPGLRAVGLGETFGSDSTLLSLSELPAHGHGLDGGASTGSTGSSVPVDEYQASIGLNYIVALNGAFPSRDDPLDAESSYLGEIVAFAGGFAPSGWAFADGRLINIAQNSALFSILGTYYGGDGVVNFALPDLRGRTIVGTGLGLVAGTQLGTGSTTLTEANLPAHHHDFSAAGAVPEPATWALMIGGFGAVGTSMRRRGTKVVAA